MIFSSLELQNTNNNNRLKYLIRLAVLGLLLLLASLSCFWSAPAWAGINDDKYEGNIFILYAGNGSLVPPRLSLKQSLEREMPTVLVYYVDDSKDCKQFSVVVSRIQEFYGRAANIMPITIDSLDIKANYTPQEPGFYYEGAVPQTVILNQQGKVVFNGKGQVKYEAIDDVLREVFNLLPRAESETLKVRTFNEFNSELVE
ncbi:MAG: thylakoid membrane photosystem I accumulation factor [Xenococcaceae cyanobacterium MO_167.B52]|nr:thylakoid membrane photosystem I accumulation factor [Xenococcaceae cyanobacterium MO_167.B52]